MYEHARKRSTRSELQSRINDVLEALLSGTNPSAVYRQAACKYGTSRRQAVRYGVTAHALVRAAVQHQVEIKKRLHA